MKLPEVEVEFTDVGRRKATWRQRVPANPESSQAPHFGSLVRAIKAKKVLMSKDIDAFPDDDEGTSGHITAGLREVGRWRVVQ